MATFIAQRIIQAANKSFENGQAKYRAYFNMTTLYAAYKPEVDSILATTTSEQYPDGYAACNVTA